MKKVLTFVLCALFAASLAGCLALSGQEQPTPASTLQAAQVSPTVPPAAEPTAEPETWETLYHKAFALYMQGERDAAWQAFEASLGMDATHSEVWIDFMRIMRDNQEGYIDTLRGALENTGDTQTFQPMLDQAIAAAEPVEDGVINWIDPVMEQLVRDYLGKSSGDIMRSELDGIENLGIFANAPLQVNTFCENVDWNRTEDGKVYYLVGEDRAYDQPCAITTLADFQNFRNLSYVFINYTGLTSIDGIQNIKKLVSFDLGFSPVNDVSPAAKAFWLQTLSIQFCGLTDVSALAELPCVNSLGLAGNEISDVSPLAQLFSLERLSIWDNAVADIAPLAPLTRLMELEIGNNPLAGNISALAALSRLENLSAYYCGIADISPLAGMINLRRLDLVANQISDISPLANMTQLTELYLGANEIADLNPLMCLSNLERLTLFGNATNDLMPLLALKKLQMLDVGGVNASKSLLYYIPEFYP